MKIKLILTSVICALLVMLCACGSSVSINDYLDNLEKEFPMVENVSKDTISSLAEEFLGEMPDLAVPKNVLIAGEFTEELDIQGYLSGEKEFDAEKFSQEFKGVVIEFDSSIISGIAIGYKDDILQALKDEGIELDESIQVLQKGQYIYIGYEDFINATYKYTPAQ